ncbi:MAG TPA: hypothetical protein DCS43_15730 [Verrucomicrobia bacterium]|nr:hypothetical protein [Verrucomicrobiota bacterium]
MAGGLGKRRMAAVCGRGSTPIRGITALLVAALGYQLCVPGTCAAEPVSPGLADMPTNATPARVYHITPEQFEELKPLLQANGFRCLPDTFSTNSLAPLARDPFLKTTNAAPVVLPAAAVVDPPSAGSGLTNGMVQATPPVESVPAELPPAASDGSTGQPQVPVAAPSPSCHDTDGASDLFGNLIVELVDSDWTSSEAGVVIFVVIGVVVVLTVVVYAGVYLYEIVTGTGDYQHWYHIETRMASLAGGSHRGQLAGVKFSAGFEREADDMRTGLILEAGYLNLRMRPEKSDLRVHAEGGYLMAGAGIQWLFDDPRNPSGFGLELLAGVADDPDVEILSIARATLGFGIGSHGRLGLSVGALLVGLDPEDGLLEYPKQFIPMIGLETGFQF